MRFPARLIIAVFSLFLLLGIWGTVKTFIDEARKLAPVPVIKTTARPDPAPTPFSTCREHVEIHSVRRWAAEFGRSEEWVRENHLVNLWQNPSPRKGTVVGKIRPGARAPIFERGPDDFRIMSPLGNAVGWVGSAQVERTRFLDVKTGEPCEPSTR